jgi:anti-sigma regulatory factor (Ser/Thr protein kinase)
VPRSADLLSLELPCAAEAPSIARGALTELSCDGWNLEEGLLVLSELVTNAVRHSGGRPSDTVRVQVSAEADRVTISVHDPGRSNSGVLPAGAGDRELGGWGLRIVEQLAQRWGVDRPGGCLVWAELARS